MPIRKGSTLKIQIENNYDVSRFDGKKAIVISTTSFLGGKNPFLGWAYIVVSIICLVFSAALSAKYFLMPRLEAFLSYNSDLNML
jgi:hypothetical protein